MGLSLGVLRKTYILTADHLCEHMFICGMNNFLGQVLMNCLALCRSGGTILFPEQTEINNCRKVVSV
jgi:hypothetical protein